MCRILKSALLFFFLLASLVSSAQTDKQGYAPKVFSKGNLFNELRTDSAQHVPHKYGLITNTTDSTPQVFAWSTPTGDSLVLFINGKYHVFGNPTVYGANTYVKLLGSQFTLDTANYRKQDSMYVVTDSTFLIFVNGHPTAFKMRGSLFSFNGRGGAIVLNPTDISQALTYTPSNLPNVINQPQVINSGSTPSWQTGAYSARPAPGIAGRHYTATDSAKIYVDTITGWKQISGGNGLTNLDSLRTATTVKILSSTGNSALIRPVDSLLAGVMVASDKIKLDNIQIVGSTAQLRTLNHYDTSAIYRVIQQSKIIGDFYYTPGCSGTDDSVMQINVTGGCLQRFTNGILYPRWFGAMADGTTNDWYPMQKMYNDATSHPLARWTFNYEGLTYKVQQSINFPGGIYGGSAVPVLITDGAGAIIKTDSPIAIFKRLPTIDTAAQTWISNWTGEIKNITLQGTQATGQIGFDLGAFYKLKIQDCKFINLDTAVKSRFFLQCKMTGNLLVNNVRIGFWSKWGDWTNGTISNDACNGNLWEDNRIVTWDSAYAGYYHLGGNMNTWRHNIVEGNKAIYTFFNDYSGSVNVARNHIDDFYTETVPGKILVDTTFKIRGSGVWDIDGVTAIYKSVLLDIDNSDVASVFNIGTYKYYMIADTPFSALNAATYAVNVGVGSYPLYGLMDSITKWRSSFRPAGKPGFIGSTQNGYLISSPANVAIENSLSVSGQSIFTGTTIHNGAVTINNTLTENGVLNINGHYLNLGLSGGAIKGSFIANSGDNSILLYQGTNIIAYKYDQSGHSYFNTTNVNQSIPITMFINGTDAMRIPYGTTAQRPTADTAYWRFNRDSNTVEFADTLKSWQDGASRNWVRANFSSGGSSFYQTVQANTTSQAQRAKLNFGTQFTVADNSGNGSTDISIATLNQNTTGTASNLSGTPTLPNGTTATTQSAGSADTKLATDLYADNAAATALASSSKVIFSATASGSAVTNTTTQTSITGTGIGSKTIAANTLTVGKTIVLHGWLQFSTGSSNTQCGIVFNNSSFGQANPFNLPASQTNSLVEVVIIATVLTTGASGSLAFYGNAFVAGQANLICNSTGNTFDTTINQTFDIQAHWTTASASNSMNMMPVFTIKVE